MKKPGPVRPCSPSASFFHTTFFFSIYQLLSLDYCAYLIRAEAKSTCTRLKAKNKTKLSRIQKKKRNGKINAKRLAKGNNLKRHRKLLSLLLIIKMQFSLRFVARCLMSSFGEKELWKKPTSTSSCLSISLGFHVHFFCPAFLWVGFHYFSVSPFTY